MGFSRSSGCFAGIDMVKVTSPAAAAAAQALASLSLVRVTAWLVGGGWAAVVCCPRAWLTTIHLAWLKRREAGRVKPGNTMMGWMQIGQVAGMRWMMWLPCHLLMEQPCLFLVLPYCADSG